MSETTNHNQTKNILYTKPIATKLLRHSKIISSYWLGLLIQPTDAVYSNHLYTKHTSFHQIIYTRHYFPLNIVNKDDADAAVVCLSFDGDGDKDDDDDDVAEDTGNAAATAPCGGCTVTTAPCGSIFFPKKLFFNQFIYIV